MLRAFLPRVKLSYPHFSHHPSIVPFRGVSNNVIQNRSKTSSKRQTILYRKVGPLVDLVNSNTKSFNKKDSAGNVLYCLKLFHDENSYLKNIETTKFLHKLKSKLENYERISSKEFHHIRYLVSKNNLSQGKLLNEFLFNLCVYMVQSNNGIIDVQILEFASDYLVNAQLDFKKMLNYNIMIAKLHEVNYFEELHPRTIYKIVYSPFIRSLKKEQYILKTKHLHNGMEFINNYKHEDFHQDLLKLIKPDIIDSLKISIELDDTSIINELCEFIKQHYKNSLTMNDFHDLKKCSIETGNNEILALLCDGITFKYDNKLGKPKLSNQDNKLISMVFLNNDDYENFHKHFTLDKDCPLFERTVLLESFIDRLSLYDFLKLIGEVTKEDEVLVLKDFHKLVPKIIEMLKNEKFTLVTVERSIPQHFLESEELPSNVKTLYMNAFLKALSTKTNITGVVHAYCQFPLELVNNETFQLLFHIFSSNPFNCVKRTIELFKFALNVLKLKFTTQEYNILIMNSIKGDVINLHQVLYFLYHYFKSSGNSYIPIRIMELLKTTSVEKLQRKLDFDKIKPEDLIRNHNAIVAILVHANETKYIMSPLEIVKLVSQRIASKALQKDSVLYDNSGKTRSVEEFFEMNYEPIPHEFNHYDHVDSKKLKLKHLAYLNSLGTVDVENEQLFKDRRERLLKEISEIDKEFENDEGEKLI